MYSLISQAIRTVFGSEVATQTPQENIFEKEKTDYKSRLRVEMIPYAIVKLSNTECLTIEVFDN